MFRKIVCASEVLFVDQLMWTWAAIFRNAEKPHGSVRLVKLTLPPSLFEVLKLNSEGQELWNMSFYHLKNKGLYKDNKIMKS